MVFFRLAKARRASRAMCESPKEIGGMGVRVPCDCGADARIDADEHANEIWGERIREMIGQMGVFGRWGVG